MRTQVNCFNRLCNIFLHVFFPVHSLIMYFVVLKYIPEGIYILIAEIIHMYLINLPIEESCESFILDIDTLYFTMA